MKGGNDSFPMEGGKTVQANKPETESKDQGTPKQHARGPLASRQSPGSTCTERPLPSLRPFIFSVPEKKLFLNMERSPLSPNGPTLSLVR